MLCAHTVRRLKPGTFEQFTAAFMPRDDEAPAGWIRFHLLRGLADPNDFQSRRDAIDPFVETVIANGVYEIVTTLVRDNATTR